MIESKTPHLKSDAFVLTRYFYHLLLGELSLGKRAPALKETKHGYAGKELKVKAPGRGIIRLMREN